MNLHELGVYYTIGPASSSSLGGTGAPPVFYTRNTCCSEPPELSGSLICNCHETNDIHTDKHVVTGKLRSDRAYNWIGKRGR